MFCVLHFREYTYLCVRVLHFKYYAYLHVIRVVSVSISMFMLHSYV